MDSRRPSGLTLRECMICGTAGFTAGLSIHRLIHLGLDPDEGPVLVTGASGGVGSLAVGILARAGYHVVASTGKPEATAAACCTRGKGDRRTRRGHGYHGTRPPDRAMGGRRGHRNISLISGPSKTADIEQTLTVGAHGPKKIIVLLV